MSAWTDPDGPPPRPGRRMLLHFLLGSVAIVLLGAGAVATALRLELDDTVQAFVSETIPIRDVKGVLDDVEAGKPQTILVLGSDKRYAEKAGPGAARSDTMMLIRLDPEKEATAVMSIPRDLKAEIPGHGTDKINAAYSIGGPKLAVTTVRSLLNIPINHVVNVNFGGFSRAVKRLGCFYIDVDRRYFNDNNPPAGGGGARYATIDIEPGYQRLCGLDSLDYVRFRHLDDDFVRAARQQSYLEQAKSQVGVGRLFSDREELLRIFGRYTQTDINSEGAILRLLRLTYEATKSPIREVRFPAGIENDTAGSYVTISDENVRKTVRQFLEVRGSTGAGTRKPGSTPSGSASSSKKKSSTKKKKSSGTDTLAPGLVRAKTEGEDMVATMSTKAGRLAVYYPAVRTTDGFANMSSNPRLYTIKDRAGYAYKAYRIVGYAGENGQYWGVQGTGWRSPPILDDPTDTETMRGRKYSMYYDGTRLRLIAWRTKTGVYWVSNTLSRTLTNEQMRDIAKSLTRVGT
jgi:polyisoprenyl-teichoic acid--peptidoglycan teichoic acid transferase